MSLYGNQNLGSIVEKRIKSLYRGAVEETTIRQCGNEKVIQCITTYPTGGVNKVEHTPFYDARIHKTNDRLTMLVLDKNNTTLAEDVYVFRKPEFGLRTIIKKLTGKFNPNEVHCTQATRFRYNPNGSVSRLIIKDGLRKWIKIDENKKVTVYTRSQLTVALRKLARKIFI